MTPLKTEGEKIQKEWSQLSELALRQNTTLQEKRKSWERRLQEFDAKSKKRAVEFQLTQRDASGKYNKALSAALDEVIAESKADLVLERSTVVRMDDSIDKTSDIIKKLDQSTPTIAVSKQSLPAKAKQ